MDIKKAAKRVWHFLWVEDSIWSWIANAVLAFLLIKFIVYPLLGLAFATQYPIVAVISSSMEHDGRFDAWWQTQQEWYENANVTQDVFLSYPFRDGFNKGDIMVLYGTKAENIKKGDIIVFSTSLRPEPIIHRVMQISGEEAVPAFTTKGDHNAQSYSFETDIPSSSLYGRAVLRIPYIGYIKIWFVDLLGLLGLVKTA